MQDRTLGQNPRGRYQGRLNSGAFDDVKVERVDLGNNKVGLNFIVKPKPIVVDYTIKGNEKYKSKKLEKLIVLEKGKPLDERKLAASRKAILENTGTQDTTAPKSQPPRTRRKAQKLSKSHSSSTKNHVASSRSRIHRQYAICRSELKDIVVTKQQLWRYIFRFGNYYNEYQHDLDKEALRKAYHAKDTWISKSLKSRNKNSKTENGSSSTSNSKKVNLTQSRLLMTETQGSQRTT